jgi:hypothetical protein
MTDPTPNWRALCVELFAIVEDEYSGSSCLTELRSRTATALAQPEPPSPKEQGLVALKLLKQRTTDPNIIEPLTRALEALPE